MIEPLAVAVYSCRRAEVCQGGRVLITGAGPIGILSLLVARTMGAIDICITDINDTRLKFAASLGASATLNVSNLDVTTAAKTVVQKLGGGPNSIIECCGADMSYKMAVAAGHPRSIIVTVGRGNQEVLLNMADLIVKEMEIRGIFRYANCYPTAIKMVSSGQIDLKPLITDRFSFDEVEQAFKTARDGNAIKVMISVN